MGISIGIMGGNNIVNKKILVMLLITIVFLIGVPQAEANRNIKNNFTTLYNVPNTTEAKLNTCKTCMAALPPLPVSWNRYGEDLKKNAAFDRNNSMQAMRNIELLDSDGDGFTNIDEIHNSTFPGDASDFPTISGSEPKPAYTIMNGFVTIIMFAIVYFFAIRKRD
jgi:preprotein translocase subunit YajC